MTERWRESLSELDTVEPSADVWARAVAQSAEASSSNLPGKRRGRILAAVVAIAVAAGGVMFAFLSLRELGTAPPGGAGLVTYRAPTGSWEIDYRGGFQQGSIPRLSQHPRVTFEGIWIANFEPPEPPDEAGGPLYYAVPDMGVVVLVYQTFGGPFNNVPKERDSSLPITFDDLGVIPGPYPGGWLHGTVVANGETYTITVRTGADASQQDEQAANDIVSSFRILPLEEGTSTGKIVTFFVLGRPDRYPVGSVLLFDPSSDHRSERYDPDPFYLVRVPAGFYALAWPGNLVGGYQDCDVAYDPGPREFSCPNGARWGLDGSVIAKPEPGLPDDPLQVLLVRISLDGHVLVSPNVGMSDTETDLKLT